jgi:putative FmdB family regulatory protein
MPIYEYQASGENSCEHCRRAFDVMQKLADDPLKYCPECHGPVHRKISRPNLASPVPSLSKENIEKHGLTQFKKVEKGVYEKTAGKGPDFISDKDIS